LGGESGVVAEVTQSGCGPEILVETQPGGSRGGVHSSKFSLKRVMHGVGEGVPVGVGVGVAAGRTVVSSVSVLLERLISAEVVVQLAVFEIVPVDVGVTTKVTVAKFWPVLPLRMPRLQVMVLVPLQLP
jgi:hypothetical protein